VSEREELKVEITIDVPDELMERAQRLAEQAFANDLNGLATAALEHYVTTQELMRQLLANPPAAIVEEPQFIIDPNALLDQAGVQDVVVQDVVAGEAELPQEAIADIERILGDVDVTKLLSGQLAVSPETAAELPPEILVPATGIVVHEPPPPPPPGNEEERVAQVLAASGITAEEMKNAADGFNRILERVETLRPK
jgi:hypothetical protein